MGADGRRPSGRAGHERLLADLRLIEGLQRAPRDTARERLERALGAALARRLVGALAPRCAAIHRAGSF